MFTLNSNYKTIAILDDTLTKKDNKRHFLRGIIKNNNGINTVSVMGSQSSSNIGGLNSANCLIVFKENRKVLKKGSTAECIMI